MSKIQTKFDLNGRELFDYEKPIVEEFRKKYARCDSLSKRDEILVDDVVLTSSAIDDMAFGYCPSGKIGELREFANALLAEQTKREEKLVDALRTIVADYSRGGYGHFQAKLVAQQALEELGL